jgi:hypothetical protein
MENNYIDIYNTSITKYIMNGIEDYKITKNNAQRKFFNTARNELKKNGIIKNKLFNSVKQVS